MKRRAALFLAILCVMTLVMTSVASASGRFSFNIFIEKIQIKGSTFKTRYKTSAPLSENSEKYYLSFVVNIQNSTKANQSIEPHIEITTPAGKTMTDDCGTMTIKKSTNQRLFYGPETMAKYFYEPGDYTIAVYEDSELLYSTVLTFTGTCPSLSWTD